MTNFVPKLADFDGNWQIDRHIKDRRAPQLGQFCGTASFHARADGLAYHETGLLTLGSAAPLTATRDYLWRWQAGRIHVDYPDGRPFHNFDPAAPGAHHLCAPDAYSVTYDFNDWPRWLARWRVTGPHKDYTMVTRYKR